MRKTVVLFPGQGTQHVGMMQDIAEMFPAADEVFNIANEVTGQDIRRMTFFGPETDLNMTINTQPCLFAAEMALFLAAKSAGLREDAFLGFSLGEWTALAAAEVLSLADAFRLVKLRAEAMQRAVPVGKGGMAVILGKSKEDVESLCNLAEGCVEPSNFNCPGQISVAGSAEGVDSFLSLAQREGVIAKRIEVSIPSHCSLMLPAAEELLAGVEMVSFRDPQHPIIMNCCAEAISNADSIQENVIKQLTNAVRMEESIYQLFSDGYDCFLELGPGKTLSGFVRKCAKAKGLTVKIFSVNDVITLKEVMNQLSGGSVCVE